MKTTMIVLALTLLAGCVFVPIAPDDDYGSYYSSPYYAPPVYGGYYGYDYYTPWYGGYYGPRYHGYYGGRGYGHYGGYGHHR